MRLCRKPHNRANPLAQTDLNNLIAGVHVWRKQLRLPLACVEWSPDGQRLLVAGASAGCSILSAAGEPLGQLALPAGQVALLLHARLQSCILQHA